MEILYYVIFLIISWLILMIIFKFSTYHKYFIKISPILIIYSAGIGFLLYFFNLSQFFIWHLIINIVFLSAKGINMQKVSRQVKEHKAMSESIKKTIKYYIISTVIYIALLSASFLFFYNY